MTKLFTATLMALVSSAALAGTFMVPPNGEIRGNHDGTVSWSGVALGSVVHFRDVNAPPVEHKVSGSSGSIKLQDVASNGGRFQVRDLNGNWAWLTPNGTRFVLAGAHLDCTNPDGCALQVDGTGPKSAPVANYSGGVYQGYAPAQQLASTDQRVAPNNGYAMTTAPSGAVVTPVTIVPPPTVVGTSQSVSAGKYKLVPVGVAASEAKKAGHKKPAAAKAKVLADDKALEAVKVDKCVPGKKFTMNGKEYLCAVLATEPVTPPVAPMVPPAASAPTTPPAATAPSAPVATAPAAPVAAPAAPAPAAPAAKKG